MKNLQKKTEDYQHSFIIKWIMIAVLFFTIVFGAIFTGYAQTKNEVYKYCDSIGIKNPDIVTNQSILETGNFQCEKCSLEKNNIFGFRYKGKYLSFDSWKKSCDYYLRWQKKYYKNGDYYDFLNCIWKHSNGECARYATDPNYTDKLKTIK